MMAKVEGEGQKRLRVGYAKPPDVGADAIKHAREEVRQIIKLLKNEAGKTAVMGPPPLSALLSLLERLGWLLDLSAEERAFVRDAATQARQPAELDVTLSVFADWLEDRGRDFHSAVMRKLTIQSGDVLCLEVRAPLSQQAHEGLWKAASELREWLGKQGKDVFMTIHPQGDQLEVIDEGRLITREACDRSLACLLDQVAGEPEMTAGRLIADVAADVISRLKRDLLALRCDLVAATTRFDV